jgi:hypothetical protein
MLRFLAVMAIIISAAGLAGGTGLADFFPRPEGVSGWTPVDTLIQYVGDDLFQMIDGGAEIYREYGFVRAGTQEFVDKSGHDVTIELYEMKDPGAAYGMFSFKTRGEGQDIPMGGGGRQTNYYLNFWKGRYLATLTGMDTSAATRTAITDFGGLMEKKIQETARPPELADRLRPVIDGRTPEVMYIRGPIALSNFYRFGASDVFGCQNGYVVDYTDFKAFVFAYDAETVCRAHFDAARKTFATDSSYSPVKIGSSMGADTFEVVDRRGHHLVCIRSGNYIVAAVGRTDAETQRLADTIRGLLRQ